MSDIRQRAVNCWSSVSHEFVACSAAHRLAKTAIEAAIRDAVKAANGEATRAKVLASDAYGEREAANERADTAEHFAEGFKADAEKAEAERDKARDTSVEEHRLRVEAEGTLRSERQSRSDKDPWIWQDDEKANDSASFSVGAAVLIDGSVLHVMLAERDKLRGALANLLRDLPPAELLCCDDFNHEKADQGHDTECPPQERMRQAEADASALLNPTKEGE
jgi:hypothetical protein